MIPLFALVKFFITKFDGFSFLGCKPEPPINLLGDFAGGSMVAVMGIMMALFERSVSGKGQVVDASIVSLFY